MTAATDADIATVLEKISRRVIRALRKRGYLEADTQEVVPTGDDPLANDDSELARTLAAYEGVADDRGRRAVVRHGYRPERQVMTGIGEVSVQVPKTRDRSGSGVHFRSSLMPPYLKRTKNVETLLPVLYLTGISTGDFQEALGALLGEDARSLSPATISRLKSTWQTAYEAWSKRDLSASRDV